MGKLLNTRFWGYIGRFSLLFVLTWIAATMVFFMIQNSMGEMNRIALDLYEPFRPVSLSSLIPQLIRALVFALILYPYYDIILNSRYGKWILFGALWGAALLGSVEPMPGSIEGMIYVQITFYEHFLVLSIISIQVLLFVWLFFRWESSYGQYELMVKPGDLKGYVRRFTVVHVVTYWVVGSAFYQISGYEEALASMEIFQLWRPLESLSMVLVVFLGQFFRGPFLALLLYPFLSVYIQKKYGWLYLFVLMFGLTALGSPIFISELLVFETTLPRYLESLLVGIPEIFAQMLLFSILFFFWQKKTVFPTH